MAEKKLYKIYEEIERAVVRVIRARKSTEPDWPSDPIVVGSGFVVKRERYYFAFTAHHVVKDLSPDEELWVEATKAKTGDRGWFKAHPVIKGDDRYDLTFLRIKNKRFKLSSTEIAESVFRRRQLKVGVEVFWVSYPAFSYSTPVLQRGIIASITRTDGFSYVIDGMVNPGSSGGPVFYLVKKQIKGQVEKQVEGQVIGVISSCLMSPHNYRMGILDQKGRVVEDIYRPSGLGIVVPMNHLRKLLEKSEEERE